MPTIISRDCLGGILYDRLGAQFSSPTINLFMTNEDFILFCLNLKLFLESDLEEETSPDYPVGVIRTARGKIHLYFMHYSSFEEAKECWERRKKRVNYSNIKVIFNAGPDVDKNIEKNFYNIPYKKILLSSNCFWGGAKTVSTCVAFRRDMRDHWRRTGQRKYRLFDTWMKLTGLGF